MKIWNVSISLGKKNILLWNSVMSHTVISRIVFGDKILRKDLSQWWEWPHLSSFLIQFFSEFLLGHMQKLEEEFPFLLGVRLSQRVALWSVIYIVFQHIIQYKFFLIMLLNEENRCPVPTRLVSVETYCWSSMSIMQYFLKAQCILS